MKCVLDTNAISALMKSEPSAVARLARTSPPDVSVPQPVLAEIAYGIERLPRSKRRRRLQERSIWGKPGSPAPSGQTPSAMRSAESRRRSRRGGSASKTLMPPLPPTPWPPAPRSSRQTRLTWSESRAFAWKTGPQKNADRWRACASACLPQLTRDRLAAPAKRGPSWLSTVPSPQLTRDRLAAPAAQRWP